MDLNEPPRPDELLRAERRLDEVLRRGRRMQLRWRAGLATNAVIITAVIALAVTLALPGRGHSQILRVSQAPTSSTTVPSATPEGPSVCTSTGNVTRLVVQRTINAGFEKEAQIRWAFPASVAVTEPTAVQSVAQALCQLPKAKPVTMCPLGGEVAYDLRFSTPTTTFPVVSTHPSGCQDAGPLPGGDRWGDRSTYLSPAFWETLGAAMGVDPPTRVTFVGRFPDGSLAS